MSEDTNVWNAKIGNTNYEEKLLLEYKDII